jgi:hypothetical protein
MSLTSVVWYDAWFDFDPPGDGYKDEFVVTTIGFLVRETDEVLSLAAERLPDEGFRAITHIPKACVRSRSVLEHSPNPRQGVG